MTVIKGPDGRAADVNELNQLMTASVSQDIGQFSNIVGKVFSIYFTVTPTAADDYFFYLKNTGTLNFGIGKIEISSTVATDIFYDFVSGTPTFVTGGGDGTPAQVTNTNLGSAIPLVADAIYDTDITGLTSQGVLFYEKIPTINTRFVQDVSSAIIIPQGKAVAFRRVAATGALDVVLRIGTQ